MTERIQWIDHLKGLAMLLVMISHCCMIPVAEKYLYACYMAMFFIASGYTFSWKPHYTVTGWIKNKAKRLLIPYFFYGSLAVLTYSFFEFVLGEFSIRNLAMDFLGIIYSRHHVFTDAVDPIYIMNGVSTPLWFLTALFVSWVLFIVLYKANRVSRALILTGYFVISCANLFLPILLPWSIDTAFIGAIFIFCGYVSKDIRCEKYNNVYRWIAFLASMAVYIASVSLNGSVNLSIRILGDRGIISLPLFILIGISGTFACSVLCKFLDSSILSKFLSFIGKNTLKFLGVHMLLFVSVDLIMAFVGINLPEYAIVIIKLLVVLVAVWVISKVFERIKTKIAIVDYL